MRCKIFLLCLSLTLLCIFLPIEDCIYASETVTPTVEPWDISWDKDHAEEVEENITTETDNTASIKASGRTMLLFFIKYSPYAGAAFFVIGIIVAIFSKKSNENRRWGLRMCLIELVGFYIIYLGAHILFDRVYFTADDLANKTDYLEDRYEALYQNTLNLEKSYRIAIEDSEGTYHLSKDFLSLVSMYYRMLTLPAILLSVFCGLTVIFIAKHDNRNRLWAFIGLCIMLPITLIVGYIFLT